MKKAKYRSRLRIVADILFAAREGSKKTHIMYKANLSYKLVSRYLTDVIEAGLVKFYDGEYIITKRGEKFIKKYQEYSDYREKLKGRIEEVNSKKMFLEKMCFSS